MPDPTSVTHAQVRAAECCRYVRRTFDGPYAMDDLCIAPPHPDHDRHGPWVMLRSGTPAEVAEQARKWMPTTPGPEGATDD
jgi:hypothetical protein